MKFSNLLVISLSVLSLNASAISSYLSQFQTTYPNSKSASFSCLLCHDSTSTYTRNSFGQDYGNNGHNFKAIESFDSDVDGHTNIDEINAGTNPGDVNSFPSAPIIQQPPTPVVVTPPVVIPPVAKPVVPPVVQKPIKKVSNSKNIKKYEVKKLSKTQKSFGEIIKNYFDD